MTNTHTQLQEKRQAMYTRLSFAFWETLLIKEVEPGLVLTLQLSPQTHDPYVTSGDV